MSEQPVRLVALVLFAVAGTALIALALFRDDRQEAGAAPEDPVAAATPYAGTLDFYMAIEAVGPTPTPCTPADCPLRTPYPKNNTCTTDGNQDVKCTFAEGDTLLAKLYLKATDFDHQGFNWALDFQGVTAHTQNNLPDWSAAWAECGFAGGGFIPENGHAVMGCSLAISAADSSQVGLMAVMRFSCTNNGFIRMYHDSNGTHLVDANVPRSEGKIITPTVAPTNTGTPATPGTPTAVFTGNADEVVTINGCGPTPTPTSTATDTPTQTPTHTPTPCPTEGCATATNTATATATATATNTSPPTSTPTITPTPTSSATATATFTPTLTPTPSATGTATFTPTSPSAPDLTLTKSASADAIGSGAVFTYTIEVRNNGNDGATNVVLFDQPDVNFTFTGFSTTRGSCMVVGALTGGRLECDLTNLGTGPGAFATVTVSGRVAAIAPVDVGNEATVDPEEHIHESNEDNNTATATVHVSPGGPGPPPGFFTQGDVDGDGDIDSVDALWVLSEEARLVASVPVPPAADVDKDGDRDVIDALSILFYVAGLIGGFPP